MKCLIIIPARQGSKRLKNKNKLKLGGKPLFQWTIEVARRLSIDAEIFVSTDDTEILTASMQMGCSLPCIRPVELATDTATTLSVCRHGISWFEANGRYFDCMMVLQPTSPFRDIEAINQGIEEFTSNKLLYPAVGCSLIKDKSVWGFRECVSGKITPLHGFEGLKKRSQDLDSMYLVNGTFYLFSIEHLTQSETLFGELNIPVISRHRYQELDIDTEEDFRYAQFILDHY